MSTICLLLVISCGLFYLTWCFPILLKAKKIDFGQRPTSPERMNENRCIKAYNLRWIMKIVRKRWNDIVPNKITDNNPLNVYLEKEKELSNISWFITKYSVSMIRLNFGESALDPLRNENDCIKVDNFKWIIKIVEDQMSIVYPNTIDRNPLDIDSVKELVKITTFLYNHTKSIVLNMMVWGVSASLVKFNFTTNRMDPPYHASKKMVT